MLTSRHPRYALLGLLCLLVGSACQAQPSSDPPVKLVITGSSTMAPLLSEIGKRYEAHHAGIRVDVQTGGSSRGLADVQKGLADIGMVSRALGPDEQDVIGTVAAYDGIGIIVHVENPVTTLTKRDLRAIYTGTFTNWKSVGGRDAPITVVNKAEGRATLDVFLTFLDLTNSQIQAHVVIGDNEQGIKTVAGNPNAIAYVSIGTAQYDAAHGVPIKLVSLGAIPASMQAVQAGQYPLARPLTLVTGFQPQGIATDFINFATSPEVHDLVHQQYFIPLSG